MLQPLLNPVLSKNLKPVIGKGGIKLFPYPTENLAGFWTDNRINQSSVEALDYTSNDNPMALNTGRAVSLGGVSDYFTIKYPGTPVAKIRVLARSATGGLVLAHPTEDAGTLAIEFLNITPNNLWQYTESIVRDYTTFPPTGGVIESDIVIGRDSSAISYFAGEIALVELIDGDDNVIDTIYLNGHEDAAGAGLGGKLVVSVNGNVGEYTGCSSVNSLPAPVPQLAGMNWNEYLYFKDLNSQLSLNSTFNSITATGEFRIDINGIIFTEFPSNYHSILSNRFGAKGIFLYVASTSQSATGHVSLRTHLYSSTGLQSFDSNFEPKLNTKYDLSLRGDGSTLRLYINGVADIFTATYSTIISSVSNFFVGKDNSHNAFRGVVSELTISDKEDNSNIISSYKFYTKTPYKDLTGPNDGTSSGDIATILIPESTTPGLDAFGTPIQLPRPTTTSLNIPSSGNVQAADLLAYNSINAVMAVVYYNGEDQTFIDLGNPEISASGGSLTSTVMLSPTYYVNGAATATLVEDSYNFIAVTTATGVSVTADPLVDGPLMVDKIALYSDPKFASETLATFNKIKSQYGL